MVLNFDERVDSDPTQAENVMWLKKVLRVGVPFVSQREKRHKEEEAKMAQSPNCENRGKAKKRINFSRSGENDVKEEKTRKKAIQPDS